MEVVAKAILTLFGLCAAGLCVLGVGWMDF